MMYLAKLGNGIFSALSVALAAVAGLFIPDAWSARSSEPEELLVLSVWSVIMISFAVVNWLTYKRLGSRPVKQRNAALQIVNLAAGTLCVFGTVLGTRSGQPSSVDLYLLLVPAILFFFNIFALRRHRRQFGYSDRDDAGS